MKSYRLLLLDSKGRLLGSRAVTARLIARLSLWQNARVASLLLSRFGEADTPSVCSPIPELGSIPH